LLPSLNFWCTILSFVVIGLLVLMILWPQCNVWLPRTGREGWCRDEGRGI
jgi:hypothetical protein